MIHYAYVRVSTEMQAERESLKTQADRLQGYFAAAAVTGFEVATDAGFSAKDTDRPALQRIMRDVRAGRVASIVVTKLDRLTRSIRDLLALLELFDAHGVRFVSLTQNLDTSTPMGRFMLQLLGIIGELERGLVSERVAEDMRVMAKKGKWLGGPVPYGYRAVEGKLQVESAEATLVKRIFGDYLELRSLRALTHRLNEAGKRTRSGQPWTPTTIRRILTSDTYLGAATFGKRRTQHSGKVRPAEQSDWIKADDAHPAIVEREAFDRVQALLPQKQGKPTKGERVYLLSGLVRCGKCGGAMSPTRRQRGDKVWSYYRCHYRESRGVAAGCSGNSVRLAELDDLVVSRLRELAADRTFLRDRATALDVLKASKAEPTADEEVQARARRLEEKLTRLVELYEDSAIDLPTFRQRKATLDAQLSAAREQLAAQNAQQAQQLVSEEVFEQAFLQVQKFGDEWSRLDPDGRKIALRSVLKAVHVNDDKVELQVYLDGDCDAGGYAARRVEAVPHGHGFMAATSWKSAGNVSVERERAIVISRSSRGSRSASSARPWNSGSSSMNRTPLWASDASPGRGLPPPPTSAA